jgi:hypothetical protein
MRIRIQLFNLVRIWILLIIIVTRKSATTGLQTIRGSIFEPLRLYFELLKLLNFDFSADPDPAFRSNKDPDPAFKNSADPDPQLWGKYALLMSSQRAKSVFGIRIRIRIRRIRMFLGLPNPRPDKATAQDPSIIKQK